MSSIFRLYEEAYLAGRDVQQREHGGEQVDGKQVWQKLEETTGDLKNQVLTDDLGANLKYNLSLENLYQKMEKIIQKFAMDKNEFEPKSNHFFCQLKNLVKAKSDFNIQLNRVMQLGFNAGQLSIFLEKNTLPEDRNDIIKKFINKYKMLELDTYVNKTNQSIINKKYLNIELAGGSSSSLNYYKKYCHYKLKYLKLKNMLKN
jgi:thermostable 8-oxoguanine DNA glycosylase